MNKNTKFIILISVITTFTAATLLWIHNSNDHTTCTTVTAETVSTTGEIVTTTTHQCKKKYSF